MNVTTFGDVKVGDTVICNGRYAKVDAVNRFAINEPRNGPVHVGMAAVELVTAEGSRWGAPFVAMTTYEMP